MQSNSEELKDLPFLDSFKKEKIKNWILSIGVVKFDLDEGQIIEAIYPNDSLTKSEQKLLSLLSFPDSNSFSCAEGTLTYAIRLKREKIINGKFINHEFPFTFGFVYFVQKKDPSISRGYFQKSIVILSNYPLIDFFFTIVEILGKIYFSIQNQDNFIEVVCHHIANWPDPIKGKTLEIPFIGLTTQVHIPKNFKIIINTLKNEENNEKLIINNNEKRDSFKKNKSSDCLQKDEILNSPDKKNEINDEIDEKIIIQNNEILLHKKHHKEKSEGESKNLPTLSYLLKKGDSREIGYFQEINIAKTFGLNKIQYLWKLWEIIITNQPLLIISDSPTKCSEAVLGIISIISPLEFIGDFRPYFTIYDPDYKVYQEEQNKNAINNVILGVTNPLFLKSMKKFPNIFHLENEFEEIKKNTHKNQINFLETKSKIFINNDKNTLKLLIPSENDETSAINTTILRRHFRNFSNCFLKYFEEYIKIQQNEIKTFDENLFLKFLANQNFEFNEFFLKKNKILKLYQKFIRSANFLNFIKTFKGVYIAKKSILI